jgi:hypothetical protein
MNDCSYASTPPPPLCHHSMYRDNNSRLLVAHQIAHKSCLTHYCPRLTLSLQQFHSWMLTYIRTSFMLMWPCIITNFFVLKPTRCTNFTNLFCHETLHVSDSSSGHRQEFIHQQVLLKSSLQTCLTYTIAECTVNKLLMIARRTVRNM